MTTEHNAFSPLPEAPTPSLAARQEAIAAAMQQFEQKIRGRSPRIRARSASHQQTALFKPPLMRSFLMPRARHVIPASLAVLIAGSAVAGSFTIKHRSSSNRPSSSNSPHGYKRTCRVPMLRPRLRREARGIRPLTNQDRNEACKHRLSALTSVCSGDAADCASRADAAGRADRARPLRRRTGECIQDRTRGAGLDLLDRCGHGIVFVRARLTQSQRPPATCGSPHRGVRQLFPIRVCGTRDGRPSRSGPRSRCFRAPGPKDARSSRSGSRAMPCRPPPARAPIWCS